MKNLYLIRGLPGSGKTTLAESLAENKYPVISADDFLIEDGVYIWKEEKLGKAHHSCYKATENEMSKNTEKIFVSNTFAAQRDLKEYLELAEKYKYKVFSLVIENRHGNKSLHDVPEKTIEKMKRKLLGTLKLT